jgi:hypothetical protein
MADWHMRYRRLIDLYRGELLALDERACMRADIKAEDWGDGWVTDTREIDPSALRTAAEIAEQFGLAPYDIQNWSRRHPDRIPVCGKAGNKNLYRVGDVLRYRAKKP